jgi:hypothetical protein
MIHTVFHKKRLSPKHQAKVFSVIIAKDKSNELSVNYGSNRRLAQ